MRHGHTYRKHTTLRTRYSMAILLNTPVWVWFLLLFLITRGVSALKPREIPLSRLFIIPLLFLAAGVYHLSDFAFYPAVPVFVLSSMLFCLIRISLLWKDPVEYHASSGLIHRPGSPFVLILVLVAFVFKFAMTVLLERGAISAHFFAFQCLWGAGSGIITGLSWGSLLYTLYRIRETGSLPFLKSR